MEEGQFSPHLSSEEIYLQDFASANATEAFCPLPPQLNQTSIMLKTEGVADPGGFAEILALPSSRHFRYSWWCTTPTACRANKPGARTHTHNYYYKATTERAGSTYYSAQRLKTTQF